MARPRFIDELFGALRETLEEVFDPDPAEDPPPRPRGAPGTARTSEAEARRAAREYQRHLNEQMEKLVEEMLAQLNNPRGRVVRTSDGRMFMFTGEFRQVRPGEIYWEPQRGKLYEMAAGPPPSWNIDIPWPPAIAGFILIELQSAYQPPPRRPSTYIDPRRAAALKVLGLSRGATPEEIKAKYRELARRYHPDANKETPAAQKKRHAEKLAKINAAASELGIVGGRAAPAGNSL